jgi:hypothetical protein
MRVPLSTNLRMVTPTPAATAAAATAGEAVMIAAAVAAGSTGCVHRHQQERMAAYGAKTLRPECTPAAPPPPPPVLLEAFWLRLAQAVARQQPHGTHMAQQHTPLQQRQRQQQRNRMPRVVSRPLKQRVLCGMQRSWRRHRVPCSQLAPPPPPAAAAVEKRTEPPVADPPATTTSSHWRSRQQLP